MNLLQSGKPCVVKTLEEFYSSYTPKNHRDFDEKGIPQSIRTPPKTSTKEYDIMSIVLLTISLELGSQRVEFQGPFLSTTYSMP